MVRSLRSWLILGSFLLLGIFSLAGIPRAVSAGPLPATPPSSGAINEQINYQGKLMDSSGSPVTDGTYQIGIAIYNVASGGTPLWVATGTTGVPTKIPVTVSNGLFTVMLGDVSAAGQWQNPLSGITNWNSDSLYIGVTVESDGEMTPRKRIGAVPQAFNAAQLQGMSASGTGLTQTALFGIYRTDTGTSLSERSALDVRTAGADLTNDYIARFLTPGGSAPVTIRNDGRIQAQSFYSTISNAGAAVNVDNGSIDANAWGAHISTLLVGRGFTASSISGADQFQALIRYSGGTKNGICLDDIDTVGTCSTIAGASIVADGTINASAFDLAEQYTVSGEVEPGDLVAVDPENPLFVKRSPGVAYDSQVIGIVSTRPGFLLGDNGGSSIALAGRVPTKVSVLNGEIMIGDALTSSPIPGVAMKATAPGQIVGYALQSANATSTIEVFVKVGYDASSFLQTDGARAIAQGDLVLNSAHVATVEAPNADSWGVTWRGSIWDGIQSLKKDFTLFTKSLDGQSAFSLAMGTSTLWSVDETGSMQVANDLFLGGRFFPATRSGVQSDKYVFLDDTGPASSTYIATNADGWQANTSYDFAERYYSPDALEPGDVVMLNQRGQFHVQRSAKAGDVPVGIVSTRPAFVAGAPAPDTYPIALAGRVPTRVSGLAGSIAVGDPLTPSSMPGVAVKALQAGPIVGYALEAYDAKTVGKIEVFVNAGWWGGSSLAKVDAEAKLNSVTTIVSNAPKSYQGVARILAGAFKVKVTHPSLGTFPLVQVTPYGKIIGQWWTDNSTDRGFEITLENALPHDVTFSWRAEEMRPADGQLFLSNEETAQWDIYTGQPVWPTGQIQTPQVPTETLPDVTSSTVTTDPATTTPVTPPEEETEEEEATTPTSTEPVTEPVVEPVIVPEVSPPTETETEEPVVEDVPVVIEAPVIPTPDPVIEDAPVVAEVPVVEPTPTPTPEPTIVPEPVVVPEPAEPPVV